MKVMIMVHSVTGNTLRFAEKIKELLGSKGHEVSLVQLKTYPPLEGKGKDPKEFRLTNLPDCSGYDAVLVGGPVWGFSPTPVAMKAIKEVRGISGKRFMAFTTQAFPFAALGGKRTLRVLGKEATGRGANVVEGVSVQLMFHKLEVEIGKKASKVPGLLG